MARVSDGTFSGDKKIELIDEAAIHPEEGWGVDCLYEMSAPSITILAVMFSWYTGFRMK